MHKRVTHVHVHACFFARVWGQKGVEQGATPSYSKRLIGSCCCPDTILIGCQVQQSEQRAGRGGSSLCSVARLQVYPLDVEI